jgi:hypothetical protein
VEEEDKVGAKGAGGRLWMDDVVDDDRVGPWYCWCWLCCWRSAYTRVCGTDTGGAVVAVVDPETPENPEEADVVLAVLVILVVPAVSSIAFLAAACASRMANVL